MKNRFPIIIVNLLLLLTLPLAINAGEIPIQH